MATLKKAFQTYQEALGYAQKLGNQQREIVMLILMASCLMDLDDPQADAYFIQAHALAKQLQDDKALSQVLEHRACLAGKNGDFVKAESYLQESLCVLERLALNQTTSEAELKRLQFFTLLNLGEAQKGLNAMQASLESRYQALELAQQQNNQIWMAYAFS